MSSVLNEACRTPTEHLTCSAFSFWHLSNSVMHSMTDFWFTSVFFPCHPHSRNTPRGLGPVLLPPKCLNSASPIGGVQAFVEWMSGNNIYLHGCCEASVHSNTGSAYLTQYQPRESIKISTSDDVGFVRVKSHYKILQCPVLVWLNHSAIYKSSPSLLSEIGVSDTLGSGSTSPLLPSNP